MVQSKLKYISISFFKSFCKEKSNYINIETDNTRTLRAKYAQ